VTVTAELFSLHVEGEQWAKGVQVAGVCFPRGIAVLPLDDDFTNTTNNTTTTNNDNNTKTNITSTTSDATTSVDAAWLTDWLPSMVPRLSHVHMLAFPAPSPLPPPPPPPPPPATMPIGGFATPRSLHSVSGSIAPIGVDAGVPRVSISKHSDSGFGEFDDDAVWGGQAATIAGKTSAKPVEPNATAAATDITTFIKAPSDGGSMKTTTSCRAFQLMLQQANQEPVLAWLQSGALDLSIWSLNTVYIV
jgi:hypothetical protein